MSQKPNFQPQIFTGFKNCYPQRFPPQLESAVNQAPFQYYQHAFAPNNRLMQPLTHKQGFSNQYNARQPARFDATQVRQQCVPFWFQSNGNVRPMQHPAPCAGTVAISPYLHLSHQPDQRVSPQNSLPSCTGASQCQGIHQNSTSVYRSYTQKQYNGGHEQSFQYSTQTYRCEISRTERQNRTEPQLRDGSAQYPCNQNGCGPEQISTRYECDNNIYNIPVIDYRHGALPNLQNGSGQPPSKTYSVLNRSTRSESVSPVPSPTQNSWNTRNSGCIQNGMTETSRNVLNHFENRNRNYNRTAGDAREDLFYRKHSRPSSGVLTQREISSSAINCEQSKGCDLNVSNKSDTSFVRKLINDCMKALKVNEDGVDSIEHIETLTVLFTILSKFIHNSNLNTIASSNHVQSAIVEHLRKKSIGIRTIKRVLAKDFPEICSKSVNSISGRDQITVKKDKLNMVHNYDCYRNKPAEQKAHDTRESAKKNTCQQAEQRNPIPAIPERLQERNNNFDVEFDSLLDIFLDEMSSHVIQKSTPSSSRHSSPGAETMENSMCLRLESPASCDAFNSKTAAFEDMDCIPRAQEAPENTPVCDSEDADSIGDMPVYRPGGSDVAVMKQLYNCSPDHSSDGTAQHTFRDSCSLFVADCTENVTVIEQEPEDGLTFSGDVYHTCLACRKSFTNSFELERHLLEHIEIRKDNRGPQNRMEEIVVQAESNTQESTEIIVENDDAEEQPTLDASVQPQQMCSLEETRGACTIMCQLLFKPISKRNLEDHRSTHVPEQNQLFNTAKTNATLNTDLVTEVPELLSEEEETISRNVENVVSVPVRKPDSVNPDTACMLPMPGIMGVEPDSVYPAISVEPWTDSTVTMENGKLLSNSTKLLNPDTDMHICDNSIVHETPQNQDSGIAKNCEASNTDLRTKEGLSDLLSDDEKEKTVSRNADSGVLVPVEKPDSVKLATVCMPSMPCLVEGEHDSMCPAVSVDPLIASTVVTAENRKSPYNSTRLLSTSECEFKIDFNGVHIPEQNSQTGSARNSETLNTDLRTEISPDLVLASAGDGRSQSPYPPNHNPKVSNLKRLHSIERSESVQHHHLVKKKKTENTCTLKMVPDAGHKNYRSQDDKQLEKDTQLKLSTCLQSSKSDTCLTFSSKTIGQLESGTGKGRHAAPSKLNTANFKPNSEKSRTQSTFQSSHCAGFSSKKSDTTGNEKVHSDVHTIISGKTGTSWLKTGREESHWSKTSSRKDVKERVTSLNLHLLNSVSHRSKPCKVRSNQNQNLCPRAVAALHRLPRSAIPASTMGKERTMTDSSGDKGRKPMNNRKAITTWLVQDGGTHRHNKHLKHIHSKHLNHSSNDKSYSSSSKKCKRRGSRADWPREEALPVVNIGKHGEINRPRKEALPVMNSKEGEVDRRRNRPRKEALPVMNSKEGEVDRRRKEVLPVISSKKEDVNRPRKEVLPVDNSKKEGEVNRPRKAALPVANSKKDVDRPMKECLPIANSKEVNLPRKEALLSASSKKQKEGEVNRPAKEAFPLADYKKQPLVDRPKQTLPVTSSKKQVDLKRSCKEGLTIADGTKVEAKRPRIEDLSMTNSKGEMHASKEEDIRLGNNTKNVAEKRSRKDVHVANSKTDVRAANSKTDVHVANSKTDVHVANSKTDVHVANSKTEVKMSRKEVVHMANSKMEEKRPRKEDGHAANRKIEVKRHRKEGLPMANSKRVVNGPSEEGIPKANSIKEISKPRQEAVCLVNNKIEVKRPIEEAQMANREKAEVTWPDKGEANSPRKEVLCAATNEKHRDVNITESRTEKNSKLVNQSEVLKNLKMILNMCKGRIPEHCENTSPRKSHSGTVDDPVHECQQIAGETKELMREDSKPPCSDNQSLPPEISTPASKNNTTTDEMESGLTYCEKCCTMFITKSIYDLHGCVKKTLAMQEEDSDSSDLEPCPFGENDCSSSKKDDGDINRMSRVGQHTSERKEARKPNTTRVDPRQNFPGVFKCNRCDETYFSRGDLLLHWQSFHKKL